MGALLGRGSAGSALFVELSVQSPLCGALEKPQCCPPILPTKSLLQELSEPPRVMLRRTIPCVTFCVSH